MNKKFLVIAISGISALESAFASGTPKGAQMEKDQPNVWGPNEYADFALERAAGAFVEAWKGRKPGGIRRAFGTARIGHCRLALYADGSAQMYGDTSRPDFVRMLANEDDGVEQCGGTYGYVPTPAAETARGYGGGVNNGQIGHEGAFKLCDRAVKGVNRLFK